MGYNGQTEKPLAVKKQVQDLIGEATDIGNLSQGMSSRLLFFFRLSSSFFIRETFKGEVEVLTDRLCTRLDAFLVIP